MTHFAVGYSFIFDSEVLCRLTPKSIDEENILNLMNVKQHEKKKLLVVYPPF